MPRNEELVFKIELSDKEAQRSIADMLKGVRKVQTGLDKTNTRKASAQFESLRGVFGKVAAAAGAYVAAIASARAVGAVVSAAQTQEDAVNSLATAINLAGGNAAESLPQFERFASELQDIAGIGDEVSLKMLGVAKSFGASDETAKKLVQAAAELSAATGKDLDSSFQQLTKTLGGFAGELGELPLGFKDLTKEQLKAGKAADLVLEQFSGASAQNLKTFSGTVKVLTNNWGDFLEAVGDLIIKNPVIREVLKSLSDVIKRATGSLKEATGSTEGLNRTLEATKTVVNGVALVLRTLIKSLQVIVDLPKNLIGSLQLLFAGLSRDFLGPLEAAARTLSNSTLPAIATRAKAAADSIAGVRSDLAGVGADFETPTFDGLIKELDKVTEAANKADGAVSGIGKGGSGGGGSGGGGKPSKSENVSDDPRIKFFQRILGSFTKDSEKAAQTLVKNLDGALAGLAGVLGGLSQGAEGASGALSALLGQVQIFGFKIGALLQPFVALADKSDEEIRETIDAFFSEIDRIVVALAERVDVIAEALVLAIAKSVANTDDLIAALLRSLPVALREVVKGLVSIVAENGAQLGIFFEEVFNGVQTFLVAAGDKLGFTFEGLIEDALNGVQDLFQGIVQGLSDLDLLDTVSGFFDSVEDGFIALRDKVVDILSLGLAGDGGNVTDKFTDTAKETAKVLIPGLSLTSGAEPIDAPPTITQIAVGRRIGTSEGRRSEESEIVSLLRQILNKSPDVSVRVAGREIIAAINDAQKQGARIQ